MRKHTPRRRGERRKGGRGREERGRRFQGSYGFCWRRARRRLSTTDRRDLHLAGDLLSGAEASRKARSRKMGRPFFLKESDEKGVKAGDEALHLGSGWTMASLPYLSIRYALDGQNWLGNSPRLQNGSTRKSSGFARPQPPGHKKVSPQRLSTSRAVEMSEMSHSRFFVTRAIISKRVGRSNTLLASKGVNTKNVRMEEIHQSKAVETPEITHLARLRCPLGPDPPGSPHDAA